MTCWSSLVIRAVWEPRRSKKYWQCIFGTFSLLEPLFQGRKWFVNSQFFSYITTFIKHLHTKFSIAPLCMVGQNAKFKYKKSTSKYIRKNEPNVPFLFPIILGKFCSCSSNSADLVHFTEKIIQFSWKIQQR